MDMLKKITLIGCLLGIAFSLVDIAAPGEKMKKQLKVVTSVVMLISIITPFLKEGLVISVSAKPEPDKISETQDMQEQIDSLYIADIERKLENSAASALKEKNILPDNLCIVTKIDEYNFLKVDKVKIKVNENEKTAASEVLNYLFGEDITVEFD